MVAGVGWEVACGDVVLAFVFPGGVFVLLFGRCGSDSHAWRCSLHLYAGWFPLHQVPSDFLLGLLEWSRPHLPQHAP